MDRKLKLGRGDRSGETLFHLCAASGNDMIGVMRSIFYTLALFAFAEVSAFCRVGETKKEVDTRYGGGAKAPDRLSSPGVETWKYKVQNLSIEVVLAQGVSIWEIYHRVEKVISDEDIEAILKVYETDNNKWRFDRKDKRWERSGKPKLIAFRWPGHEDYLCVQDAEAYKAAEKAGGMSTKGL